ncbi:hypothetical protein ACIRS1_05910 [Kitasatospora sp. NPDC101176]|uniref:hypothetical protein n=1 Tax=Kitasatospora sp. NPDC101176 TaxID=3364099 RepID=UPI00382064E4
MGRTMARAAAAVLAAAFLAGAASLAWWAAADRMAAAMGLGPADGVVLVERCYDAYDSEGGDDGTDCVGRFTPAGAPPEQARPILLKGATGEHPAGARLTARLAGGVAYEPSSSPAVKAGIVAAVILALGAAPAGWLLIGAWRGRTPDGGALVVGLFVGLGGVAALGIAVGLVAGLVEFVL